MKLQKNLTVLLSVLIVVLLIVSPRAFAGPDLPVVSEPIAIFTGNQSKGISSGVDVFTPPITQFWIDSLTTDITPLPGLPGVNLFSQSANGSTGSEGFDIFSDGGTGGTGGAGYDLTAVYLGGDHAITTSGWLNTDIGGFGIIAQSLAGRGGNGGDATGVSVAYAGDGGRGGNGGMAWIFSDAVYDLSGGGVGLFPSSDIATTGHFAPGIYAVSRGGDGGSGGDAGAAGYSEGGDGGVGGSGGQASVISNTHITTAGWWADGISANSLGGGGGAAGTGTSLLGQGGSAQGSGPGGPVSVINYGTVETEGLVSDGIFAQSVGGFAGGGGSAYGLFAWGGSANSAGDGGYVNVGNSGDITTGGALFANSIFAQSVGGGGGKAGASGGLYALGGDGVGGGNGNVVTVTNSGVLQTVGNESRGILAQSLGGGGGAGGSSYSVFAIGGTGSSTGDGGDVIVINSGAITTGGNWSSSILAQSVGGGGGVGGSGGSGYSFFFTQGGDSGAGGSGGNVKVDNSAALATSGADSSAILAQSIGGGGGAGGGVYNVDLGFGMSLGGASTLGGHGGQVDVDSGDTSIITAGTFSHGIHAMSTGGGGGSGGNAINYTGGVLFSSSLAMGGQGGGGGNGWLVDLTSHSQITTQGEYAHGLYAESIGGGGGSGGNADAWGLVGAIPGVDELPSVGMTLSVGGNAGAGGHGWAVDVDSTGDISTSASHSYGIFAQSIGGGGGSGGDSTSSSIAINSLALSMAVGGQGGDGGSAYTVDVTSSGNIATQGNFAYGILGQSIGGGGGAGGSSKTLLADIEILTGIGDLFYADMNLTMSVGGKAEGGGNGWQVDIKNTGYIDTKGTFAHGILAQSVGGGGGVGGDSTTIDIEATTLPTDYVPFLGFMNTGGKVLLGGSGGAGGNGWITHVDNRGTIVTEGNFANGILAQSVGGGGGAAGYIHNDIYRFTSPTSAMVLQGSGGNVGSGSDVTVTNSGDITTHGGFAHGILAQSIGGGGGFGGISEDGGWNSLVNPPSYGIFMPDTGFGVGFAGSAGGWWGSAGAVKVNHTGTITTHGDVSHGILAQSAAGSGTAGPVNVTLASEIMADGVDSDGIHAQSIGGSGNGDIAIDIGGGTVRGGSGAGAGVNIDGGFNNMLTNAGNISALSGMAIVGGVGNDIVNNNSIVTGSVNLGTGANAFNNNPGATFNAGALVNLGAGNALTNAGVFSPGGSGTVLNTTLIGDLVQLASGLMEIEIGGFTPGTFDFIDITGTADLTGGNINFSFLSGYDIVTDVGPGETWELTFLSADSIESFNSVINYNFMGLPYFHYDVFQRDNDLIFQATNTVPLPGAFLLGCIGLGCIQVVLRRTRHSAPRF
jgi:hypothetical protein